MSDIETRVDQLQSDMKKLTQAVYELSRVLCAIDNQGAHVLNKASAIEETYNWADNTLAHLPRSREG